MNIFPWNGRQIQFPGIYSGVPIDVYHSAVICPEVSISSSGLRIIFRESPAHYWSTSPFNENRIERAESAALVLGQATHHLLLGEANFKSRFAIRPEMLGGVKWTGKGACKIWLEDRKREGRRVITRADVDRIHGMKDALWEQPLIQHGVLNGHIETTFAWKDVETGIWLRARPDALPTDSLDFADLKTTESILEDDLRRTIFNYGYYQQAALIAEGCYRLTRMPMNTFSLVFVESKPPHCVAIVTLKDEDIQRGHRANRTALRTFAECWQKKKWPGPWGEQRDAAYIEMPSWSQQQIDFQIEAAGRDAKEKTSKLDNRGNSIRDKTASNG